MFVLILGNGNSGAEAANVIYNWLMVDNKSTVLYYYEYPPHDNVTFVQDLKVKQFDKENEVQKKELKQLWKLFWY